MKKLPQNNPAQNSTSMKGTRKQRIPTTDKTKLQGAFDVGAAGAKPDRIIPRQTRRAY